MLDTASNYAKLGAGGEVGTGVGGKVTLVYLVFDILLTMKMGLTSIEELALQRKTQRL